MDSSFDFDYNALCSFCRDYEISEDVKKESRNGNYFNKVGPNKDIYGNKGTYYIPYWSHSGRKGLGRSTFYKLCAYHCFNGLKSKILNGKNNHYINFAQYLPEIAPLCLDFDLVCKFDSEEKKKFKSGDNLHIYNYSHILKIVESINKIIFSNFEISQDEIKSYVFEKEEFKFKSKTEVKDGIHLIYLLPFNTKQRWFIREEIINELKKDNFKETFDFEILNDYEDIIDQAVISRNPWLTFGSVKVNTKTLKDENGNKIYYTNKNGEKVAKREFEISKNYNLTHILDFSLYDENLDCFGQTLKYETEEDIEGMLNLFDLEQFSNDDPLIEKTDKVINFEFKEKKRFDTSEEDKSIVSIKKSQFNNFNPLMNRYNTKKPKSNIFIKMENLNIQIVDKIIDYLSEDPINYIYERWFLICCMINNCVLFCYSKDDDKEKKAKKFVYKFCSKDKKFIKDNFSDDYLKISKASKSEENKKTNVYKLIEFIQETNIEKANVILDMLTEKSFSELINTPNDFEIAKYLHERFKNIMICTDIKNNKWYYFPSVNEELNRNFGFDEPIERFVWEESKSGLCVDKALRSLYFRVKNVKLGRDEQRKECNNHINNIENDISKIDREIEDSKVVYDYISQDDKDKKKSLMNEKNRIKDEKKMIMLDIEKVNKIFKKLGSNSHKNGIIKECCKVFYNSKFVSEQLNENRDVLCFNNGVYNFKTKNFEPPNSEYYSTFSTNYNYYDFNDENLFFNIKTEEVFDIDEIKEMKRNGIYDSSIIKRSSKIIKDIENYMKTLIVNDEDREYMYKFCASLLTGYTKDQCFHIWTGNGSNGKSMFSKFIATLLGDYHSTGTSTIFTNKKSASNAASPEIANKKGVRVFFSNEPESDDVIYAGKMKEYTGDDLIETRALYSDPITFKPQFKIILICNNIPDIRGDDEGIWRRVRIVDFSSRFIVDLKENDYDNKLFKADQEIEKKMLTNKVYAAGFAWLLINKYYIKYESEGLNMTKTMEKKLQEYKEQCDPFGDFLNTNYRKVDQKYITENYPYYPQDTPENERSHVIYKEDICTKYNNWTKSGGCDSYVLKWKDIRSYIIRRTNCKIIKEKSGRYRIVGLIDINKIRYEIDDSEIIGKGKEEEIK